MGRERGRILMIHIAEELYQHISEILNRTRARL